jgi:hypothetical protein
MCSRHYKLIYTYSPTKGQERFRCRRIISCSVLTLLHLTWMSTFPWLQVYTLLVAFWMNLGQYCLVQEGNLTNKLSLFPHISSVSIWSETTPEVAGVPPIIPQGYHKFPCWPFRISPQRSNTCWVLGMQALSSSLWPQEVSKHFPMLMG